MKGAEKILLTIYLLVFIIKVFAMPYNDLIFTAVSLIAYLFYLLGSWYFLGLPYNKLKTIVLSIFWGLVYSFAFISVLFIMQHWEGGDNFFYLSEVVLIITIPVIYLKIKISDSVKSFLLIRSIALLGFNLIAFIL